MLDVSPGIITPFFFHTYVISLGSPLAVTVRVILEPASAVTSPDELVMYAEAVEKMYIYLTLQMKVSTENRYILDVKVNNI